MPNRKTLEGVTVPDGIVAADEAPGRGAVVAVTVRSA